MSIKTKQLYAHKKFMQTKQLYAHKNFMLIKTFKIM